MKKIMLSTYLLGVFFIAAGANHFLNAQIYLPQIPGFLPKNMVNISSGIVEMILGIGDFSKKCRKKSATGIFILMVLFLPLHVFDIFKENPSIGNHTLAFVRLPFQFIFMYWATYVRKNNL